ncbi:hypothetical protein [Marinomonas transparens]|uniref:Uncharacterized protein n=1 Tax=Marinomonas transparens TaxID=2795388 RepID=A0A934JLM5_9GAMM|nr:hypothetical protein [Marinomonas transparens]MBJ7538081.1 hypothetical protein [Marinomonas transparens]
MTLISSFFVAVYSTTQCSLFDSHKVPIASGLLPPGDALVPDASRIEAMQNRLFSEQNERIKNVVVVVPDDWLSISEHEVDHLIPPKLAPLVALTYAVEDAFAPPENLRFSYRQKVVQGQHTRLMVFTCTGEQADLFCSPFKQRGMSCLLVPHKQWLNAQREKKPWRWFVQQSLQAYQPEKEKRQEFRRLIACLASISLLVNLIAYLCFDSWNKQSRDVLFERQQIMVTQSSWSSNDSLHSASDIALKLTQGLPISVRLNSVEGNALTAVVMLTLAEDDAALLLDSWREKQPEWQWKMERLSSDEPLSGGQEEVVDVAISISKN